MAIKWKSGTDDEQIMKQMEKMEKKRKRRERMRERLRSRKTRMIAAIAVGLFFLICIWQNVGLMNTYEIWACGIPASAAWCYLAKQIADEVAERIYSAYDCSDSVEIERIKKTRRRNFIIAAVFFLFFAFVGIVIIRFLNYMRYYDFYYYSANYAAAYLVIFVGLLTAVVWIFSCEMQIEKCMEKYMESVRTISREQIDDALAKEKESLMRMAKSERLKVDLISNVSHDLKTPLTSLVGYVELLKKEELDDAARDYVDVISAKAEKLKTMIDSLFQMAKASSGNVKLNPENVELNMLVDQLLADMGDRIDGSLLEYVPVLTDEDTHIVTDNIHLYRICQNIIENTLKYSADHTRVYIKTGVSSESGRELVWLEVTNTSREPMDFDPEEMVERFTRGDSSRTTEGSGLGLAIVSTFASALGGTFDLSVDCDQFRATVRFPREFWSQDEYGTCDSGEQETENEISEDVQKQEMENEEAAENLSEDTENLSEDTAGEAAEVSDKQG